MFEQTFVDGTAKDEEELDGDAISFLSQMLVARHHGADPIDLYGSAPEALS